MRSWVGSITFESRHEPDVKLLIQKTSRELGLSIPGYFTNNSEGFTTFSTSRYPRRAGDAVPPVANYRRSLDALATAINPLDGLRASCEESLRDIPSLRIVLGLEEGYFEGKKKEVLAQVTNGKVSTKTELEAALTTLLGDYSSLGIDISECPDLTSAVAIVQGSNLGVRHTLAEVKAFLGEMFEVTQAQVFSVRPEYTDPYEEPAAAIEAPATKDNFEKFVLLANAFKQARFSVENLATGAVVNIEIEHFSTKPAAA
jgi:hypothetical protein